ncbi:ADP-ribosylation factor-like protein 11 [Bombina bombina]|uniref:ADP-ribosylation factor-like protein 11 n=1 Tax=Bombina bombina TaxID=8345 RepID=UPI00235B27A8|nr:ADP-ribosylation factor-like protein 11 [Bombina bombina]
MGAQNSKSTHKKQARVVMMGLDFSGKSTILYRLKLNQIVETFPTVGFNVESLEMAKNVFVTIWDVGGQDKLRSNWKEYLEDTDVLIFVVDSSDIFRLPDATAELLTVLNNANMSGIPFLILANKQDVPGAEPIKELVHVLKLENYDDRPWEIHGCSAHTGEGLVEAMHAVSRLLKKSPNL